MSDLYEKLRSERPERVGITWGYFSVDDYQAEIVEGYRLFGWRVNRRLAESSRWVLVGAGFDEDVETVWRAACDAIETDRG